MANSGHREIRMSRLAVLTVCLLVLNGVSGCACCSCCPRTSGCCPSGGDYLMNDGYPQEMGYDMVYESGPGECCGGNGGAVDPYANSYGHGAAYYDESAGMPLATQRYRPQPSRMTHSGMAAAPQYEYTNMPLKVAQQRPQQTRRLAPATPYASNIRQSSMSTWEPMPGHRGAIVPQSYSRPAPCNCGK